MKVDFVTKMSFQYSDGYVCADKAFHIKTKYKVPAKYFMNIPNCPEKHIYKDHGEIYKFSIVFPPLETTVSDILETKNGGFRFYGV